MTELGYPNSDVPLWNSLWAPAGTPREIIVTVNRKVAEIGATEDMQRRVREISVALPDGDSSPDALAAFFDADSKANADLIRDAKITLG